MPITVESAAVIEPRALSERCPACSGALKLLTHAVDDREGKLLRRVELACSRCARPVSRWFAVSAPLVH